MEIRINIQKLINFIEEEDPKDFDTKACLELIKPIEEAVSEIEKLNSELQDISEKIYKIVY